MTLPALQPRRPREPALTPREELVVAAWERRRLKAAWATADPEASPEVMAGLGRLLGYGAALAAVLVAVLRLVAA